MRIIGCSKPACIIVVMAAVVATSTTHARAQGPTTTPGFFGGFAVLEATRATRKAVGLIQMNIIEMNLIGSLDIIEMNFTDAPTVTTVALDCSVVTLGETTGNNPRPATLHASGLVEGDAGRRVYVKVIDKGSPLSTDDIGIVEQEMPPFPAVPPDCGAADVETAPIVAGDFVNASPPCSSGCELEL
jgi:hypothetical protein